MRERKNVLSGKQWGLPSVALKAIKTLGEKFMLLGLNCAGL
jgi:hypothetical protein